MKQPYQDYNPFTQEDYMTPEELARKYPASGLQPYQQRVVDEKAELDEKREKLGKFIESDAYQALSEPERDLLSRQAIVMAEYSDILGTRIATF